MNLALALTAAAFAAPWGTLSLGIAATLIKGWWGPNKITDGLLWSTVATCLSAALSVFAFGDALLAGYLTVYAAAAGMLLGASPWLRARRAKHLGMLATTEGATTGDLIDHYRACLAQNTISRTEAEAALARAMGVHPKDVRVLLTYDPDERIATQ